MTTTLRSIALYLLLSSLALAQVFDTPQGYYEDASRLRAAGDNAAAAVQLRNALQLYSDHVPSLLLLGIIQLELRESGEAMNMLEEALLLGADPLVVVKPLSQAYLQRGEYSRLLQQLTLEEIPHATLPELLAAHAQANIALARYGAAETLIERGLELAPASPDLQFAQLTLMLRQARLDESEKLALSLRDRFASDTRAWNAWASVRHARGDTAAAVEAYEKAVDLEPYNADARLALISLYVDSDDLARAATHSRWMRGNIPSDPRAAYFSALIAGLQGDREKEKEQLEEAALIFDAVGSERLATDPQMQMLAALTYYSQGTFEKARGLLAQFLSESPEDAGAARLLASTQIALGEGDAAVQLLQPFHRRSPEDEATTILLASALNAADRPLEAARLLQELPGIGGGSHRADQKLAVALLDAGDSRAGTTLLKGIFGERALDYSESLMLVFALLRDGAWLEAQSTLDHLHSRDPDNPLLTNLTAIALSGGGERDKAIRSLEELTAKRSDFYPAWANLSRLRRLDGDLDGARRSLEAARRIATDDPRLDYEMALQFLAEGEAQEALRYAERASVKKPGVLDFALLETDLLFALGNTSAALDAALRASSSEIAPPAMRRLLAAAQARSGDSSQALITLKRAARAADFNAVELHLIAEQQMVLGDYLAAAATLDAALKGDASYLPARRANAQTRIGLGDFDEAVRLSRELLAEKPGDPTNLLLLGESLMAADAPGKALDAFEQATAAGAGTIALIGQVDALNALSRGDTAAAVLASHVDAGGRDPELTGRYADVLIRERKWADALPVLESMAERYPGSWSVINNLAAVRFELGLPDALATARQALALDPTNPYSNDTVGWILLASGQADDALGFLREATTRAASNPELRYHLAAALNALGRRSEARAELERALASGSAFPGRGDAEALLERLPRQP